MKRTIRAPGFTLIEMVLAIVLLGILAGVVAPVIIQNFRAYSETKARADIVARGRLAMERLTREVRHAVPNSINPVTGGIEFVRSVGGGRYIDWSDDFGTAFKRNNFRFRSKVDRSELYVAGQGLAYNAGEWLVIGNTAPADLRSPPSTATQLNDPAVIATSSAADGTDKGSILDFNHFRFPYASPGKHYDIADATVEVGLTGSGLYWHERPGLGDYNGNPDWDSTQDPLLVDGVQRVSFNYIPGTPYAGGVLQVDLQLAAGGETIRLYEEIHVRNTP